MYYAYHNGRFILNRTRDVLKRNIEESSYNYCYCGRAIIVKYYEYLYSSLKLSGVQIASFLRRVIKPSVASLSTISFHIFP